MTGAAAQRLRILLVDDSEDSRALLSAYLQASGYECLHADSGEAGLRQAQRLHPDLILLDVLLPNRDGYDICQALKRQPDTHGIPVILVTSLEDSASRIRGFEADADEFLSKPVHRDELLARVASMLRLRRATQVAETARLALEAEKLDRVKSLFGRYMSPPAVERVLTLSENERESLLSHVERVDCAIMFTDIRGFTALAEALPPEEVVAVLNRHFEAQTTIAHAHGATIFNTMGDGLLAGFGAPLPHPEACAAAVRAALDMQAAFESTSTAVLAAHGIRIGLGIGIHYGPVIVGNVGSESFLSYTVIGDTVNVAARVTGQAPAGATLLTGAAWATAQSQLPGLRGRALPPVRLKGKTQDVVLHQLISNLEVPRAAARSAH